MSDDMIITRLSVYPQSTQIVDGWGRIIRDREYWCVDYTVSRPGYVDRGYCPTFTSEEAAHRHVEKLRSRVRFAAAALGVGEEAPK